MLVSVSQWGKENIAASGALEKYTLFVAVKQKESDRIIGSKTV